MRPVFEKTPQRETESFHCEVVRGRSYNAKWHFHPELQITLALQSHGYRLVGDKITPLKPGDLVLLGANLPHVWYQDPTNRHPHPEVHAIIVRFRDTFAGGQFLNLPEMEAVRRLFRRASRGLEVFGPSRAAVAERLEGLPQLSGLGRLRELLGILDQLAHAPDLRPIASASFVPDFSTEDQDRMGQIVSFINEHLSEPIGRAEVAARAHLSVSGFSRFFKLRMGKSLPEYLNELRVSRACRLLADERLKVTDIAMQCGFCSLANFNRRFRAISGMSPREYRLELRRSADMVYSA